MPLSMQPSTEAPLQYYCRCNCWKLNSESSWMWLKRNQWKAPESDWKWIIEKQLNKKKVVKIYLLLTWLLMTIPPMLALKSLTFLKSNCLDLWIICIRWIRWKPLPRCQWEGWNSKQVVKRLRSGVGGNYVWEVSPVQYEVRLWGMRNAPLILGQPGHFYTVTQATIPNHFV